jgi:hypothetical protein
MGSKRHGWQIVVNRRNCITLSILKIANICLWRLTLPGGGGGDVGGDGGDGCCVGGGDGEGGGGEGPSAKMTGTASKILN